MPSLERISPVVLTYNEEANIARTLEQLTWALRVIVVDSGSDDSTVTIAESFRNVEILHHAFDSHREQWAFAVEQCKTEWAFCLDADYQVPELLVEEIAALGDATSYNGYFASFHYRVIGRTLKRVIYPPRQVLFRVEDARFIQDGHTQRVIVEGDSGHLRTRIVIDDRKSFRRWLENQAGYVALEARKLRSLKSSDLQIQDRIRRTAVLGPPAMLVYCMLFKGLFLDGWAGWYYTLERTVAEALLSMALLRLGSAAEGEPTVGSRKATPIER